MKTPLTPLQKLYWEREKIIDALYDKRIKGNARNKLIAKACNITREMNEIEVKIA